MADPLVLLVPFPGDMHVSAVRLGDQYIIVVEHCTQAAWRALPLDVRQALIALAIARKEADAARGKSPTAGDAHPAG